MRTSDANVKDSDDEAAVRSWLKAVFLSVDDMKSLALFSDRKVSLREHLRSGVVLCSLVNALKPNTVGKVKTPAANASRFAKLEALNAYKRGCASLGLTERDCLEPTSWLEGDASSMEALCEHLSALSRLFPKAPKFVHAANAPKAPPKRKGANKLGGGGGPRAAPLISAREQFGDKASKNVVTRKSVGAAGGGANAWRANDSNANAARAVFEVEKTGLTPKKGEALPEGKGTGAAHTIKSSHGATHSFAESETIAFSQFINEALGKDDELTHLLPINPESMDLFDACKDGVILCKLINCAQADTVDLRCVHTGHEKALSVFEVVENLNMAINAAVAIGCRVVNIGPDDVMAGSPHLVLGLLWQIVKAAIMASINLKMHPELAMLLPEGEGEGGQGDIEALKALSHMAPEKVLMKWINFQAAKSCGPSYVPITNFGSALKDCTIYSYVLRAVAPEEQQATVEGLTERVKGEADGLDKAQIILDTAEALGVTQFKILAEDIAKGNDKLNMGFAAAIFNALPGLAGGSHDLPAFNPALASASAEVSHGGKIVKFSEAGVALFGSSLEPNTGVHHVDIRIKQCTASDCTLGMLDAKVEGGIHSPGCVPGLVIPSVGLANTGSVFADGDEVGSDAGAAFVSGDLIRIEYDSDKGTVRWCKNGARWCEKVCEGVPAGMHFAIGRASGGEGVFEVEIEASSFVSQAAKETLALMKALEEDENDSREERAFRMWINSLGLETHVTDLAAEVRDGLLLLRLMDAINPGVVDWSRVDMKPKNIHAKVINCNYAILLGKERPPKGFGFSLVGISGKDIQDGIVKLVLALTWQLMRFHVIRFLSSLSTKQVTEKDVLQWANAKVTSAGLAPVQKLSDASLATGTYVLTVLKAVAPRAVDMSIATPGATDAEKKLNARLAISCARKAGCRVFCLWEDITECKPKMMLVLLATLMQLDLKAEAEKAEQ